MPRVFRRLVAVLVLPLLAARCSFVIEEPRLHDPSSVPVAAKGAGPLKVHLRSGELLVLGDWRVTDGDRLTGTGDRYDSGRSQTAKARPIDVPLAEVALLETTASDKQTSVGLGFLGFVTLVIGGLTVVCTADPKGCFGSCPTFYVESPDGREPERPQAEGFSESIARVLEARDLDALRVSRPAGSRVTVVMRNEAQETHAVRSVRLLAVPRAPGGAVFADSAGRLHSASALVPPLACRAPEGDCLPALATGGGRGRSSRTDGTDLAAREIVELAFPTLAPGRHGIVVSARQTLLSTFLFYQTMAYTGRRAGEFLAAIERGGAEAGRRALGMARALGAIEVEIAEGDGAWRSVGRFDEAGPIAGDVKVLPFEASGNGPLRARLRLARGHWRLESLQLAVLGAAVEPVRLEPVEVERGGTSDVSARERLVSGSRHLVTLPGDSYRLAFRLPRGRVPFELFLESEGYYYEWMRRDWLGEENPRLAQLAVADPAAALRLLAPAYKAREDRLEEQFWASRFRK